MIYGWYAKTILLRYMIYHHHTQDIPPNILTGGTMGYKDTYLHCIQNSQFQFLIFNINYLLKYKITSLIYQLLYTIKYIYLIGLASISTIIILILSLVIFNPQLGYCITILLGYLVNRPQVSIRYSPGTILPYS